MIIITNHDIVENRGRQIQTMWVKMALMLQTQSHSWKMTTWWAPWDTDHFLWGQGHWMLSTSQLCQQTAGSVHIAIKKMGPKGGYKNFCMMQGLPFPVQLVTPSTD